MIVFLTIKDQENCHHVIFSHRREVEARYDRATAHWYSASKRLHDENRIYGWSCIGTQDQVHEVLSNFADDTSIEIKGHAYNIRSSLRGDKFEEQAGEQSVSPYPAIFEKYRTKLISLNEEYWLRDVAAFGPELLDATFCNHISGLVMSGHNYGVIEPRGFWAKDELLDYFRRSVIDVVEEIAPTVELRGLGHTKADAGTGFKGLCSHFPDSWTGVQINFYDLDKTLLLHSQLVFLVRGWGEWEAKFESAPARGIVEAIKDGVVVGANKFALLLDINVDVKMQEGGDAFVDAFGRKRSAEKANIEGEILKSLNWNPDYELHPQKFSDDLVKIISRLGEDVLIQDPFFLGLPDDAGGVTSGTKSFLNSVILSIVNYGLKKITFLIDAKKSKATNAEAKNKLEAYLNKTFSNLKALGLNEVTIAYAKFSFHDRYYLGLAEPHHLYHVSKSISGYLASADLNISLYSGDQRRELIAQIRHRLQTATKVRIL